ncbi:tyrosine-type recombinase/integrase [Rhodobium gokarnense]|uniref:Integrase n=1 Tax=Rhodobium gokarnense TaxID=364296 RepID=A0ABT3HAD5_9HYPH|nr:integrase family protein [Rhodobium gokarnense]MCW2307359.1 integrase [Rhodobium gokarnense]
MPKLYLTDTFVRSARCPADKYQELFWDHPKGLDGQVRQGATNGLGLRVTAQGAKAFVHVYRFDGKRRRVALGAPGTLNVGSARLLVQQRENQIRAGEDPDAAKVDYHQKHTTLVSDIAERYWRDHISKKSAKYQNQYWRYICAAARPTPTHNNRRGRNKRCAYADFGSMYGQRSVTAIKPTDVANFLDQFEAAGSWNTAYRHLKAMFNWAIRMQIIDMRNPCDPIRQKTVLRQRRDYTPAQIKAIARHIFAPVFDAPPPLDGLTGDAKREQALANGRLTQQNAQMEELCHFMGILFLTMARPNELRHAEFAHFDLDQLIWHKHHTKGIKLSRAVYEYAYRSVPIHPKVAELVRRQRSRWPNAALVFPSHADPTQPRDNFRKPLARFKQLDGVPEHFQLYDLKRIAISLMLVGQGVRREDVSHYVDHKGNLETTMIYDLGFVDPMRPVTDKLGQLLGV